MGKPVQIKLTMKANIFPGRSNIAPVDIIIHVSHQEAFHRISTPA